jgi:hypothetical protein
MSTWTSGETLSRIIVNREFGRIVKSDCFFFFENSFNGGSTEKIRLHDGNFDWLSSRLFDSLSQKTCLRHVGSFSV